MLYLVSWDVEELLLHVGACCAAYHCCRGETFSWYAVEVCRLLDTVKHLVSSLLCFSLVILQSKPWCHGWCCHPMFQGCGACGTGDAVHALIDAAKQHSLHTSGNEGTTLLVRRYLTGRCQFKHCCGSRSWCIVLQTSRTSMSGTPPVSFGYPTGTLHWNDSLLCWPFN